MKLNTLLLSTVFALSLSNLPILAESEKIQLSPAEQASYQIVLQSEQPSLDLDELTLKTGKNPSTAIALSIIPGAGQFYNGDMLSGSLYALGAVSVLVVDAVLFYSLHNTATSSVLLLLPALSAASMYQASTQTQEQAQIKLTF